MVCGAQPESTIPQLRGIVQVLFNKIQEQGKNNKEKQEL